MTLLYVSSIALYSCIVIGIGGVIGRNIGRFLGNEYFLFDIIVIFLHISKSNVSCLLASLMRFSATLKYLGSFSMPIYCLFSMMAATQVVPLPIVLSKITPPPFGYKSLSGSVADPRASVSDGTQWSHALSEYG